MTTQLDIDSSNKSDKIDTRLSENNDSDKKVDHIMNCIGEFGYWQAKICTICLFLRLIVHWNIMSMVFLFPKTKFRCSKFIAGDIVGNVQNSTCYNDCEEYEYENTIFDDNLVSLFGLICDRAWLANFAQTLLMLGFICGVTLFGSISDRFGRLLAIRVTSALAVICMIAAPFSNSYIMFVILRFLVGVGAGGIMTIGTIIPIEIVGPKYRDYIGALIFVADNVAVITLALAYFTSSWQWFLEGFALFSVLLLASLAFMSETPRWLILNGKSDECFNLIKAAVKFNNTKITDDFIQTNIEKSVQEINASKKEKPSNYLDLFRKDIIKVTLCSIGIWMMFGLCYFGVNQYTTYIGGSNVYLIVIINGLIQMPAVPIGWLCNRYGRKLTFYFTCGFLFVTMLALTFMSKDNIMSSVFGGIGISVSAIGFQTLYVYTSELFPTKLRSQAFGTSSGGSKFAATISPYIATLEPLWLPSAIFAVCPVVALVMVIMLPETKGKKLEDK